MGGLHICPSKRSRPPASTPQDTVTSTPCLAGIMPRDGFSCLRHLHLPPAWAEVFAAPCLEQAVPAASFSAKPRGSDDNIRNHFCRLSLASRSRDMFPDKEVFAECQAIQANRRHLRAK